MYKVKVKAMSDIESLRPQTLFMSFNKGTTLALPFINHAFVTQLLGVRTSAADLLRLGSFGCGWWVCGCLS